MTSPFSSNRGAAPPPPSAYRVSFSDGTSQVIGNVGLYVVDGGSLFFHAHPMAQDTAHTVVPLVDGGRTVVGVAPEISPEPTATVVNAYTVAGRVDTVTADLEAARGEIVQAVQDAEAAQQAAAQAAQNVQVAVDAANGKNRVVFSTETPTADGDTVGDVWWRYNPDGGAIVGAWRWDGDDWQPHTFGDGVLDSLSVGKLVTGTLAAGVRVTIGDSDGDRVDLLGAGGIEQWSAGERTFWLSPAGDAFFAGVITGHSTNFEQALSGWLIEADGDAAFERLRVFQSLTAETIEASSISVAGRPLETVTDNLPQGLATQGIINTADLQGVTAETGIAEIGFTAEPGRGYEIVIDGPEYASTDAATAIEFRLRYTYGGTAPTPGSTNLKSLGQEPGGSSAARMLTRQLLWYPPGLTGPTEVRVLLTFRRAAGTGTVEVSTAGDRRAQMYVKDAGVRLPNSMRANHATVVAPPPPPAPPVRPHSETFYTMWGASYRGDGSRWSVNQEGWLHQGNDGYNGDQLGMVGFDLAYIRNKLAGATITSATFYARAGHTYSYGGGVCLLGSHGNDTMPATRGGAVVLKERRASVAVERGGWVGIECLGVMQEIQASQASGFTVGRAGTLDRFYQTYYYQYPHADRPRVVVHWER